MLFGREGECSSIENFANHRNEKSHLFKGVSNPDQLAEKIKSLGGSPVIKKESEDFIMVNEDSMGVGVIFIKKEMCKEIISGPR